MRSIAMALSMFHEFESPHDDHFNISTDTIDTIYYNIINGNSKRFKHELMLHNATVTSILM